MRDYGRGSKFQGHEYVTGIALDFFLPASAAPQHIGNGVYVTAMDRQVPPTPQQEHVLMVMMELCDLAEEVDYPVESVEKRVSVEAENLLRGRRPSA